LKAPAHARENSVPLGKILHGDCLDILPTLPEKSVDVVFADPPYFLQLSQELYRPNQSRVRGVKDAWDHFRDFEDYDAFTRAWLSACRRVLKPSGSLWVIGTYHNIFRVGRILQDLDYWILNDVVWVKTNPMPNFRGVRFSNAHETLIWAVKSRRSRYTFNYRTMKELNDGLQMRSDWRLPICTGKERIRTEGGVRAHATQKPEELLRRVLLASTRPGDVVLDPFFGTGTTGAVAKRLGRGWIGIEKEKEYIELARRRIAGVRASPDLAEAAGSPRRLERVSFRQVMEAGLVRAGQRLYFEGDRSRSARVRADGDLVANGHRGSIHQVARLLAGVPCNGWTHWYYPGEKGDWHMIDELRQKVRGV
jgi:modification methylase